MKTFFKFILILLLVVIVLGGSFFVWWKYSGGASSEERSAFSVIPPDAVYVVETNNLTKAWKEITSSNIWSNLIENPYFADMESNMTDIDGFLKNNKAVDMLLVDRELFVSAHMVSGSNYEFLFIIDLQDMSKTWTVIKAALKSLDDYDYKEVKFEKKKIIELTDKKTKEKTNISLIDNLLVISFNDKLIKKSISESSNNYWENNKRFQKVSSEISENRLFSFYFNYNMLERFSRVYLSEENDYLKLFNNSLDFTAFNTFLENEQLTFEGYTILDSLPTYLTSLSKIEPASYNAYKILPKQTAFYMALTFGDSDAFFNELQSEYAYQNKAEYDEYNDNMKKVTDFLGLDLEKTLFSWIGEEIAVAKLRPSNKSRLEDIVIAIHTDNLDKAKGGMAEIMKRVKKRTPTKFDSKEYQNMTYYNLKLKGFFKLFLGNMFKDIEIPYFTYLDDYVVFTNSEIGMQTLIDSYVTGSTMAKDKGFVDLRDEFEIKANLTMFVNMPRIYQNLYYHSQRATRQDLEKNKDLILSFEQYGFQLVARDKELLATTLIAKHNPNAAYDNLLTELELEATDGLNSLEYENLTFKITQEKYELGADGNKQIKYEDNKNLIYAEGGVLNKKVFGLWRTYYKSGNIMCTSNYNDKEQIDGEVSFYWDSNLQTIKAEIVYKEDKIINLYREYYKDGDRKAEIRYKNGKADGVAKFYYPSGPLKIEGEFKKGVKTGKWKYYTKKGDLINLEKYRKGKKKS